MPPLETKDTDILATLPATPEILAIAGRVNWYTEPRLAIVDTVDFLAHLMTYGRFDDVAVVQGYLTLDEFRRALICAPPGIMDARSWNYWNLIAGHVPVPPMPRRAL